GRLVIDFHELADAMETDPDVAFEIHAAFPRDGIFHEDRILVDRAAGGIDAAHLIDGVLDEPDLAVAGYRHAVGAGRLATLDACRHIVDRELFRLGVEPDHLVRGDGIEPDGAVRVNAHRIAARGSALQLGQLVDFELLVLGVVAEPPPVRAAVDEPELAVGRAVDRVQAIRRRYAGRRRDLGISQRFSIETAELAADTLRDPAVALKIDRDLVRLGRVVRQLELDRDVLHCVAFDELARQAAVRVRLRPTADARLGEVRERVFENG